MNEARFYFGNDKFERGFCNHRVYRQEYGERAFQDVCGFDECALYGVLQQ